MSNRLCPPQEHYYFVSEFWHTAVSLCHRLQEVGYLKERDAKYDYQADLFTIFNLYVYFDINKLTVSCRACKISETIRHASTFQ